MTDHEPAIPDAAPPRDRAPPPRTGDVRLLCLVFAAVALTALPGALRTWRMDEPPRLDVAPARISVNRAPPDELEALPGVGPALASRITTSREDGPFLSEGDLLRVPGVGPTLASRIAPHADFDPAPPDR
jgi:hypothetical protein